MVAYIVSNKTGPRRWTTRVCMTPAEAIGYAEDCVKLGGEPLLFAPPGLWMKLREFTAYSGEAQDLGG